MEFQFNASEWQRLTPTERARRCRILAAEAEALASCATSHLKALYLGLAIQWKMLAEEDGAATLRPRERICGAD
jgi:hypothetical protein